MEEKPHEASTREGAQSRQARGWALPAMRQASRHKSLRRLQGEAQGVESGKVSHPKGEGQVLRFFVGLLLDWIDPQPPIHIPKFEWPEPPAPVPNHGPYTPTAVADPESTCPNCHAPKGAPHRCGR